MGISIAEAIADEARHFGFDIELLSNDYIIGRKRDGLKFSLIRSESRSHWRLGVVQADTTLFDESGLTYGEVLTQLERYGA